MAVLITQVVESIHELDTELNIVITEHIFPEMDVDAWRIANSSDLRRWAYPPTNEFEDANAKLQSKDPATVVAGQSQLKAYSDKRFAVELRFPSGEIVPAVDPKSEIRMRYAMLMESVAAPYSETEQKTWFTQLKESDEFMLDQTAEVPMISAMALHRGLSVGELVSKIKGNDILYRAAIGDLLGLQQAELDAQSV